jgi:hypothetical protein
MSSAIAALIAYFKAGRIEKAQAVINSFQATLNKQQDAKNIEDKELKKYY